MATTSRMGLTHPDLATAGGSALWTQINNLYLALGNHMPTRWLETSSLANGGTVTLTHGFQLGFALMRFVAYSASAGADDGTDTYTRLNINSTGVTIVKNATNPTTQIDVTNNTGSTISFLRVLAYQDKDGPYDWFVDPSTTAAGNVFTSLASAISAASAGDKIYVKGTENVSTLITQGVNDLTIEWAPGAITNVQSGSAQTAGISVTGARCRLIAPYVKISNTAAVYAIKVSAADLRISDGIVEANNGSLTMTAPLQVNSGGNRCYATYGILVTSGTVTNDFEDNVGTLRGSFAR